MAVLVRVLRRWSASFDDHPGRYVALVTAVLLGLLVLFVVQFATQIPWADEWDQIEGIVGTRPFGEWLWAQHNEHRYPLPKLIFWAIATTGELDLRWNIGVNVVLLVGSALVLLGTARVIRGRWHPLDVIFPALLFHWGQYQNYLLGYQVAFFLPLLLACVWLSRMVLKASPGLRDGLIGSLALLLMMLCGGIGLAFSPWIALWLCVLAVAELRSTRPLNDRLLRGGVLMVGPLVALAYVAVYFWSWTRYESLVSPSSLEDQIRGVLEFGAVSLGPAVVLQFRVAATIVTAGALLLGTARLAGVTLLREGERLRAFGLLLFLGAFTGMALAVGVGRGAGLASRYVPLSALGLFVVVFVAILYGPSLAKRLPKIGWACALLIPTMLFLGNVKDGLRNGRFIHRQASNLEDDLRGGMPTNFLVKKYSTHLFYPMPFPMGMPEPIHTGHLAFQDRLDVNMSHLRTHKVGLFSKVEAMPPHRDQDLSDAYWERSTIPAATVEVYDQKRTPTATGFSLPSEQHLLGVEMEFTIERDVPWLELELKWTPMASGDSERVARVFRRLPPGTHRVYFWVDDRIERFRIAPYRSLTPELKIQRVTLVLPDAE